MAGAYPTRELAEAEAALPAFGDVQGFYVDASDNYRLLGQYIQVSASYAALDCRGADVRKLEDYPGACDGREDDIVYVSLPVRLCLAEIVPTRDCVSPYLDEIADSAADELRAACARNAVCEEYGNDALEIVGNQFVPGQWLLLTAFRTRAGAEEFLEFVRMSDFAHASAYQVVKLGGPYIGLGQESHPDGSGPLLEPLTNPLDYQ